VLLVAPVSMASAVLPGLERVVKVSAFDSVAAKLGSPNCPAGKKLIGAGGGINTSAAGKLALDEITPYPNLSGVNVIGVETPGGTPSNWSLTGYAICETFTVLHRLELKKAEGPIDSSAAKSATAVCSPNKKVVGAGGQINGPAGKVVLDEITPLPNLSGVTAVGVEIGGGTSDTWSVGAYAICAYAPNVPGLQLVPASSPLDSSAAKSVAASCPAGKKLSGAGGQINTAASGQVVLEGIVVHPSLDKVTAAGVETGGGTLSNWDVKAFAICATP
jgi:hypothetical protein